MEQSLDQQQQDAVNASVGPIWVTAGPGAGKTFVICERIKRLCNQYPANHILALTFTRNAADEMAQRVMASIHKEVKCHTFHAFCRLILNKYGHHIGIRRGFDIVTNPSRILKQILKESSITTYVANLKVDIKRVPIKQIESILSSAKKNSQNAISFQSAVNQQNFNYPLIPKPISTDDWKLYQIAARMYCRYEPILKSQNKMDFDMLLLRTMELFNFKPNSNGSNNLNNSHPLDEIIKTREYDHIVIDEFQDTTPIQFDIVKTLVHRRFQIYGDYQSIFVVGDHDQNIYKFAGAQRDVLQKFKGSFPRHRTIQIHTNYRSTKSICNVAKYIINQSKDPHRGIPKNMVSNGEDGEPVLFEQCKSEEDEAHFVIERLSAMYREQSYLNLDSVAILFRMSSQTRVIEKKLNDSHLPYTIAGGDSFYQRIEIMDIVSMLKVIHNQQDDESMRYIMECRMELFKGIGHKVVDKIIAYGQRQEPKLSLQLSLFKLGKWKKEAKLSENGNQKIKEFLKLLIHLRSVMNDVEKTVVDLVDEVLDEIEYKKYIQSKYGGNKGGNSTADEMWQNVQELVKIARDFDENIAEKKRQRELERFGTNSLDDGIIDLSISDDEDEDEIEEDTLSRFLQHIALNQTVDKKANEMNKNQGAFNHPFCQITGRITMSTIHKAKGLEWDTVFLIGCSEGILPHSRALQTADDIEEERRLAFVAVSRAKKRLYLSYAAWQRNYDSNVSGFGKRTKCSRFFSQGCPMKYVSVQVNAENGNNSKSKKARRDNVFKKSRYGGNKRKKENEVGFERSGAGGFRNEEELDRLQGQRIRAAKAKKVEQQGMGFIKASSYQLVDVHSGGRRKKWGHRREVEKQSNPAMENENKMLIHNDIKNLSLQNRNQRNERKRDRENLRDDDFKEEPPNKRRKTNNGSGSGQSRLTSFGFRTKPK